MIPRQQQEPIQTTDPLVDMQLHQLTKDAAAYREVGCELAQAAMYVIQNHDGLHRLSLAVARWAETVANEGGRKELYGEECQNQEGT